MIFNTPCDLIATNNQWIVEPNGDGYSLKYQEAGNYLNVSGGGNDRLSVLGGKMKVSITAINDKHFRITFSQGPQTFCFDSTSGGSFILCGKTIENQIRFLYRFQQASYTPFLESNTYYVLEHLTSSDTRKGLTPVKNEKIWQGISSDEVSEYEPANLWKFVEVGLGLYHISNMDGFAFESKVYKNGQYSIAGAFSLQVANIKKPEQLFRLVRSPFHPDKFYIKPNNWPHFCFTWNFASYECRQMEEDEFHFTVRKPCGVPIVRQDVWYQLRNENAWCLSIRYGTEVHSAQCTLAANMFWKFTYDEDTKGYIVSNKSNGKVLNNPANTSTINVVALQTGNLSQRWNPAERSVPYHTMFELRNRFSFTCYSINGAYGGCNWAAFMRPVQPVFEVIKEDPFDIGYQGQCGGVGSPFDLNPPAPNPPSPPSPPTPDPPAPIVNPPTPDPPAPSPPNPDTLIIDSSV
jgi:hypothetical protein